MYTVIHIRSDEDFGRSGLGLREMEHRRRDLYQPVNNQLTGIESRTRVKQHYVLDLPLLPLQGHIQHPFMPLWGSLSRLAHTNRYILTAFSTQTLDLH